MVSEGMSILRRRGDPGRQDPSSREKSACRAYGPAWRYFNAFARAASVIVIGLGLSVSAATAAPERTIVALGDSLTAGYGLPTSESFVPQLNAALRRAGVNAHVINAGVSGDTSADGLARVDWLLEDKPDLVMVELGANDALRGLDPGETKHHLAEIIDRIKHAGARVLLIGMKAPPNLGPEYTKKFDRIFPDLAKELKVPLYPFFLDGVAANAALNQADGMHPNAKGVSVIVKRMVPVLTRVLGGDG
jgi:acyl-CoA thioesterase-1